MIRPLPVFMLLLLAGLLAPAALAHPAVGIVRDNDGNIFYSDTANVWRIDPHGAKAIVVPNVHTDAITARSGLREAYRDFFFTRDRNGNMYWLEKTSPVTIFRRSPGGPVQTLAQVTLHDPGWLSATADGDVLIADGPALYRINAAGKVQKLSSTLSDSSAERYAIMGAWKDSTGNIYVAVYGDSQVKKIDPSGRISTALTSAFSWSPTGGCSAPDGSLWVLENSKTNVQRVRHIAPDGKEQIF
jgi:streptogramin lyase